MNGRWFRGWMGGVALAALLLVGCNSLTAPGATPTVPSATQTTTTGTTTPAPVSSNWASFVVADTSGRNGPLTIENVNPFSGKRATIATATPSNQNFVDAISHDGQLVAYHLDDGSGSVSYSVAKIDGSGAHAVTKVQNVIGQAIWLPDNAHLVVGTQSGIVKIDATSGAKTTVVPTQVALVATSPDGTIFYGTGTGANSPQGALLRIPADGTPFLQLSPRITGGRFIFSADGTSVYYQNTGPSGTAGIYQVNTQTGASTQVRSTNDFPVGFATNGSLLVVHIDPTQHTLALIQLGPPAAIDQVLVPQLLPAGTTAPAGAADVAVAPDGTGVIVRGSPGLLKYRFYFVDLTSGSTHQPQQSLALDNADRGDLAGWDTVLLPATS